MTVISCRSRLAEAAPPHAFVEEQSKARRDCSGSPPASSFGLQGTTQPWPRLIFFPTTIGEAGMDKDRIKGSAQQVKGSVKETAGKALGDAELQSEGKADKAEGKIRNAV